MILNPAVRLAQGGLGCTPAGGIDTNRKSMPGGRLIPLRKFSTDLLEDKKVDGARGGCSGLGREGDVHLTAKKIKLEFRL